MYPIIPGYSLVAHIYFHFEIDKSKEHGQKFVTNEYPGIYSEVYVQGFPYMGVPP